MKSKHPRKNKSVAAQDSENALLQDAPRAFRQMQKYFGEKQAQAQKRTESLVSKKKPIAKGQQNAESLQSLVHRTSRQSTKTYQKKKEWLVKRRKGNAGGEDEYKEVSLVEKIPFGQVVDRPPALTAIPRLRGYIPGSKPSKTTPLSAPKEQSAEPAAPSEEKRRMMEEKGPGFRKTKLKNLTPADRLSILKERERIVGLYRANKSRTASRSKSKIDG